MSYLTIWFWNDIWAAHVLREIHTKGTNNVHPKHDFSAVTSEPHTGWTDIIYLLIVLLPTNSWLLSCRWMCPSAGAFWTALGWWSTYSEASFTFLSALTWCQRSSFRAAGVSTFTSRGPFPTSNEKSTWVGAGNTNTSDGCSDWYLADG